MPALPKLALLDQAPGSALAVGAPRVLAALRAATRHPIGRSQGPDRQIFVKALLLVSAAPLTCAGNHSHYGERRLASDLGY
jgi:hypothetical protein